jgi:hypothetical protein
MTPHARSCAASLSHVDNAQPQHAALEGIESLLRAGVTVSAAGAGETPSSAVAVTASAAGRNPVLERALAADDVAPLLSAFLSSSALWTGVGRMRACDSRKTRRQQHARPPPLVICLGVRSG